MSEESKVIEQDVADVSKELNEIDAQAEELASMAEEFRLAELAVKAEKQLLTKAMFHSPTKPHNPAKGSGKTSANALKTEKKAKIARKMAKKSRKINRGK